MGVSRDTFYRYKHAVDEGGVDALLEQSRRQPNIKNRVEHVIEDLLSTMLWIILPMDNIVPVMSCVNKA